MIAANAPRGGAEKYVGLQGNRNAAVEPLRRFFRHVDITRGGHWIYRGVLDGSVPRFHVAADIRIPAFAFAWVMLIGDIPADHRLARTCTERA